MQQPEPQGIDRSELVSKASELLVATAEGADGALDSSVSEVLSLLRHAMMMDVVFVSEFVDGQRVFRHVEASGDPPVIAAGQSDPLESSWCQRVVDGRLPRLIPDLAKFPERDRLPMPSFDIGTHLSVPVTLPDGRIYGTLCCFSFSPSESIHENDLDVLQGVAFLLASGIKSSRH